MKHFYILFFLLLTVWSANSQTVSNLTDTSYAEGASAITIDTDVTLSGGPFDSGSLLFDITNSDASDQIGYFSDASPTTYGAISFSGGYALWGNGTTTDTIGTIDITDNGVNGNPLKINFSLNFANTSFEESSINDWTYGNTMVDLGTDSIAGLPTPTDPTDPPFSGGDSDVPISAQYYTELVDTTISHAAQSLILRSTATVADSFDVVHGPYTYSAPFEASSGDDINFDWKAEADLSNGDAFDVFGYLLNTTTGATTIVLDTTGPNNYFQTSWATGNVTVPVDGTYRLVFVNGTYDHTGAGGAGARLFIDKVRVLGTPIVSDVARHITYQNTCGTSSAVRNLSVTVTDENSSSGNASSTITLNTNAPVANCKDITVVLDSLGNASIAEDAVNNGSTDDCSLTFDTDTTSFSCSDIPSKAVTLTATDTYGNTNTCTATVTVQDTTPPTALCQDVTVVLDTNGNATTTVTAVDNGSSDNCTLGTLSIDVSSFSCTDVGTPVTVTLTVPDVNGNSSSCTSSVTVQDTTPPVPLCQDVTAYLDSTGNVTVSATDIDNGTTDDCSFTLALVPSTFDCSNLGDNPVVLTATDVAGNTAGCSATVTIMDTIPLSAAVCQDVTAYLDNSGNVTVSATDVDNGTSDNCSFTLALVPSTFDCSNIGGNPVVLTATDASGNSDACSATVTVMDTISPLISCQNVTAYLSDEEMNGNATITADKNNPGVAINFPNVLASWSDNCDITTSLDVSTFTCGEVGPNAVLLTATDEGGNTATCSSVVTVLDSFPPHVITQDINISLDDTGNFTITADTIDNGSWDNCGIANMLVSPSNVTSADTGVIIVTLAVTDVNGNSATNTASVTVVDSDPPVVNAIPLTVELYENGEYVLSDADIVYISKGSDDNPTTDDYTPYDQMRIDIFPKSFECIHALEPVPVVVYAWDLSGNMGVDTTWVTVVDDIAPVMRCVDSLDVYLDMNGTTWISPGMINDGNGRASVPEWARTYNNLERGSYDACGIDSAWIDMTIFNCGDVGANVVTLSMIDPSMNLSTCSAVITVMDTIPPTIAPIADIEVEIDPGTCETSITYPDVMASDNCNVIVALSEGLGSNGMFPLGTTTETWVATDPGGNSATVSFNVTVTTTNAPPTLDDIDDVTVDEDTPPVNVPFSGVSFGVDCQAQDISVTATGNNPSLVTSITVNYTSANATGSVDLTVAPEMSGEAIITVSAIDSEGASVSKAFTITVNPVNDPPFLVTPIDDQTINASKELTLTISSVLGDVFDDIDDATLTMDVMLEGGGALPAWASISGDVLTLKPMIADTGCVNVVVSATDAAGATATDTFEVCVDGYPVSVIEIGQDVFEVEMYPNPTRGKVNLDINASQIYDVDLTVTDITGKMVYRHQYSAAERITFDMSDKVSGMYFVQLGIEGKQVVRKLIVDRK